MVLILICEKNSCVKLVSKLKDLLNNATLVKKVDIEKLLDIKKIQVLDIENLVNIKHFPLYSTNL